MKNDSNFLEMFARLETTAGLIAWVKASPKNRELFYSWLVQMCLLPSESQEGIQAQLCRIADAMMRQGNK